MSIDWQALGERARNYTALQAVADHLAAAGHPVRWYQRIAQVQLVPPPALALIDLQHGFRQLPGLVADIRERLGDFDDWIAAGLSEGGAEVVVFDAAHTADRARLTIATRALARAFEPGTRPSTIGLCATRHSTPTGVSCTVRPSSSRRRARAASDLAFASSNAACPAASETARRRSASCSAASTRLRCRPPPPWEPIFRRWCRAAGARIWRATTT